MICQGGLGVIGGGSDTMTSKYQGRGTTRVVVPSLFWDQLSTVVLTGNKKAGWSPEWDQLVP